MERVRTPDFFIVGAPKCGTTAMYEYLRQHPDIYMPETKEIPFFGTDVRLAGRCTREEFLRHFADAHNERRVGTVWVLYLYSKSAAREIREFDSTARVIIMLRNPVEMMFSLHSHLLYTAREDIPDFDKALDAEPVRRQGRRLPANLRTGVYPVEDLFYREHARYAASVERYFDVFGRDRVHVVIYDDFAANTEACYREALRFLDVDDGFKPEFRVVHPNHRAKSRWLQNLILYPPRPLRAIVKPFFSSRALYRLRELNTVTEERSHMDPSLRRSLQAEFAPDVARLGELLNRDLSHWTHGAHGSNQPRLNAG